MLSEILARLEAVLLPLGRWVAVEIAEDIDAVGDMAGLVESGTAIIMPWRERAGAQQLATGGHRQRVETQFMVGMVLRNYDQKMGGDRAKSFDALKADMEGALAGWEPDSCDEPCELIGGESSPISKGVSIYVQTWATARFLEGV